MTTEPRLYVEAALTEGAEIALERDQAHYLRNVMRLGHDATMKLFNGRDGEWRAPLNRFPETGRT